jgi:acyl carrier protein
MHHDISATVRRFIGENFMFREEVQALPENASLLDAGIIDSTGVLELVCFLESTFGIEIADEEMLPENLDSLGAISSYVKRKVDPRQAPRLAHLAAA